MPVVKPSQRLRNRPIQGGRLLPIALAWVDDDVQIIIAGSDNAPFEKDHITDALVVISGPHREIHEGEMFSVSYKSPDGAPIADDGTIIFVLTTGSLYAHLSTTIAGGGDAQVELREGVTVTGGTAMVEFNRNRASDNVATVAVVRDPGAIVDAGTLIEDIFSPGGTGGNAPGNISGQRLEWVLNINTVYMLRLTNRAGNAQPMSLEAIWYEEGEN